MPRPERTAAILVAAGRGLRAGAGGPKQYREIGGQTVIFRAMEAFCRHPDVFAVQPVVNPDDAVDLQRGCRGTTPPAAHQWRRDASGFGACRARSAGGGEARHRSDPRRRAALRDPCGDFARDRCRRPHRRGGPCDPGHRHDQADRRYRRRRGDARTRTAANRADAASVSLRCDSRCPSPRRARWPQRFHRRCSARRMGGIDGSDL